MLQQQDSLHTHQGSVGQATENNIATQHALQLQADSTEQSVYTVKANHWPVKVDSVLMPDLGKELKATVNPLPKYYKKSFFTENNILNSELEGGRYGVAGDPVPYTIHGDNILTCVLIFAVLMLMYSVKRSSRSFVFQIRNFFHQVRTDSSIERESATERRYLLFAEVYAAMILSLVFFFYTKTYIGETYVTYSEYTLMGIYFGGMIGLMVVEHLLQTLVNSIFFAQHQREQWTTIKMMTNAWAGILLTPMLLLLAYFGLSTQNALVYTIIVLLFVKFLLFFKCYQIFFSKKGVFLQIFLYFCTLEIIPPLILWGVLVTVANCLKVNY